MLFATLLKYFGNNLVDFLTQILFNLCQSTLDMIKDDFLNYPDFREGFFKLLFNIVEYCTVGLF